MKCLRCGNEEMKYFYCDDGIWYCRKCIAFGRIDVGASPKRCVYKKRKCHTRLNLPYALSVYQKKASKEVIEYVEKHRDVLIYAATGAGKTEIVMPLIEKALNEGKKVGMAISRRQVVLELKERLQRVFSDISVIAVCEGHTHIVDGDLIVCTMHQLYRYDHVFDLLIMDEVDAFPYYGNEVLEAIANHSCTQEKVYLTATPDKQMIEAVESKKLAMVKLFIRPHGKPLIEPKCLCLPFWMQVIYVMYFLKKKKQQNKQVLVFVPTIRMANQLGKCFQYLFRSCFISSQVMHKDELIEAFRQKQYDFMITTTILERGITIPNIDVVVLCGEHIVFNEASLVQIFGRVGRSMKYPYGEAVLLCRHKNKEIRNCLASIAMMNQEGGENNDKNNQSDADTQ